MHARELEVLIREGIESGDFRALDPELTAHAITVSNFALVSHWLRHKPRIARGDLRRVLFDLFAFGLTAVPTPGEGNGGAAPAARQRRRGS